MDRERFLNRIAKRLGRPRVSAPPRRDVIGVPQFYRDNPFGNGTETDFVARFERELTALSGHVDIAHSQADVRHRLQRFIDETSPSRVVTWHRAAFSGWDLDWLWERENVHAYDVGQDPEQYREYVQLADIGITTVDYAIANTGTLILCTSATRPRSVSLLPAVHVALVREEQIVPRMGDIFATLIDGKRSISIPSSIQFITGPSRSSDIENDLSIGVHGPVAVRVIVLKQA